MTPLLQNLRISPTTEELFIQLLSILAAHENHLRNFLKHRSTQASIGTIRICRDEYQPFTFPS